MSMNAEIIQKQVVCHRTCQKLFQTKIESLEAFSKHI